MRIPEGGELTSLEKLKQRFRWPLVHERVSVFLLPILVLEEISAFAGPKVARNIPI